MFERYTEEAIGVMAAAAGQANRLEATHISPFHLLLGLLLSDRDLFERLLAPGTTLEDVFGDVLPRQIAGNPPPRPYLPLSKASKEVLLHAAEFAEWSNDSRIRTRHLLLGVLRDPESSDLLTSAGITYESVQRLPNK